MALCGRACQGCKPQKGPISCSESAWGALGGRRFDGVTSSVAVTTRSIIASALEYVQVRWPPRIMHVLVDDITSAALGSRRRVMAVLA
eukprot:7829750-Pyramimonas_sp.AAC.1